MALLIGLQVQVPAEQFFSVLTPWGQTTGADSIKIQITKNTTGIYQGIIFVDSGIGGIKSINLEIHIVDVINNIFIPKVYR